MKENKPFEALFEADEPTVSRIAAQCPADWDENRIFKRSYQKYKAKRRGAVLPLPHRRYRDPLRAAFTVACLMVTVGGAGSIWYFKYAVEKPDMSVNVDNAPTDGVDSLDLMTTEDTTQTASGASHTVPTDTVPTETVPTAWEMDTELHTTAPATTSAEKTAATRETAVTSAHTTTASQTAPQTTMTQTATTVRHTSQAAPSVIVTATAATGTDAAPTFPPTEPDVPDIEPTEPPTEPTEPPAAYEPSDSDFMGEPTEPPEDNRPSEDFTTPSGDAPPSSGSGFTFREGIEDWKIVTFQSSEQIALDKPEFSLRLSGFTMQPDEQTYSNCRNFKVQAAEGDEVYWLTHTTYDGFLYSYRISANDFRKIKVDGQSCYLFWLTDGTTENPPVHKGIYTLLWDDGAGIASICGVDTGGETLMKIAASIIVTL